MSKQIIHELAIATQQGEMTFTQVVKGLLEVGVESYLVEFATRRKTHYLAEGSTHIHNAPHQQHRQPEIPARGALSIRH